MKKIRLISAILALIIASSVIAQDEPKSTFDIYGFIMMDAGYNANQIQPDWFDVVRPTKLPTYKNQYGTDGNFFFSVRQTRLGFKSSTPTALGDLKTQFEFEMYGTGVDAGQTTIRLRHAYAELGKFGVGQYWSPFMDIDVFPNTVEYWGPNGMVFFRNVQFRYMPIQGESRLTFALERPGASADGGTYADRVELQGIEAKFPVPDFSFEYRHALKIGYVELAGIARWMQWEDLDGVGTDFSGNALGWGANLSTNLKLGANNVFRGQFVYGAGIQNYMNDAPVDVAIDNNKGVAIPMYGAVAFVDHTWSKKFTTSLGWSMLDIQNTDGQDYDAFSLGHYAVGNLMYYPVDNAMMGIELQYGTRENYMDDADPDYLMNTNIFKVQLSFKYNFAVGFGK